MSLLLRRPKRAWAFASSRLAIAAAALYVAAILASCQSAPPAVDDPAILSLLPGGARTYFYLNVHDNHDLAADFVTAASGQLSSTDARSRLQPAVDRTYRIYGAFRDNYLYLIGVGNYPAFLFSLGLKQSGQWKERTTEVGGEKRSYWQQTTAEGRFQIARTRTGILLASDGDIASLLRQEELRSGALPEIPDAIVQQFQKQALVIYAPQRPLSAMPADGMRNLVQGLNLSMLGRLVVLVHNAGIQSTKAALLPAKDDSSPSYKVGLALTTRSDRDARTVSVLLRLALVSKLARAESISGAAVSPTQVMRELSVRTIGPTVEVSGITLQAVELAPLIFQFTHGSGIN